ncbi:FecR family protein [Maribacter thermophilus]|uniref:FecR family protein n=1 Tax=Maribacter thermophilus TaxID=1197874 RepID=UPI00064135D6|nr:FecR family protein [Maribacter thermophilus]
MTEKEVKTLMDKYLNGTITATEEKLLEKFDASLIIKNKERVSKKEGRTEQLGQKLLRRIHGRQYKKSGRLWVKVAASIAIIINLGVLAYLGLHTTKKTPQTVSQIVETTDWGKRKEFVLSDGTKIKLNTGSTLSFPEKFIGNTREVTLIGEAFFNVAKDAAKPFIIKSGGLSTKVLGTSFNVNAYPGNNEISVTVATGKVQIDASDNVVYLHPNQQGVFHKNLGSISKKEVDTSKFINWQKGILKFSDITVKEALGIMEKWYGVTFVVHDDQSLDCHITASFDNETLSNVLASITYVKKGLSFKPLKNNNILIQGTCIDKN